MSDTLQSSAKEPTDPTLADVSESDCLNCRPWQSEPSLGPGFLHGQRQLLHLQLPAGEWENILDHLISVEMHYHSIIACLLATTATACGPHFQRPHVQLKVHVTALETSLLDGLHGDSSEGGLRDRETMRARTGRGCVPPGFVAVSR